MSLFQDITPQISNNNLIRTPQKEAFESLVQFAAEATDDDREASVVLPVGCGKSGCITLSPFAFRSNRTLVVAPGVSIARQLLSDFDPSNDMMFYRKCRVLTAGPYPEPVEIRGTTANRSDMDEADVIITNIQQLQGEDNRWLQTLPEDYFDLILFDEGHHSIASSWTLLKSKFPRARIVNFSATPLRADGQLMTGRFIYSYPIYRAIEEGYVKRLKAVALNPRTLRYVRREDDAEIEISLEEVRRLGEEEADFRRSIVTSAETLNTIVDASINELNRLRRDTGENRHKIIASALNYEHCRQIVEAYRARSLRADYVHSRENSFTNDRILGRLDNHELDVIVQVRKLGEGFDHKYLSVAAVFSIFSNLSPFVQFVGRIMRVIIQNSSGNPLNQGVVVFHAGANVARRWEDFRNYSQADQEYFDQLLPLDEVDPSTLGATREIEPNIREISQLEVRSQSSVTLEEIPLLQGDEEAMAAIRLLRERGYSVDDVVQELERIPVTRVRQRQAMRGSLDTRVRNEAARLLAQRNINPEGRTLDRQHLNRSNLIVVKSAIDRIINNFVGRGSSQRHEFSREELDRIDADFDSLVSQATTGIFNG
ncbi:DEAD/DEAH box helicase family protein [Dyadobacter sp. LJ53]|uniref:DEAD/DEAH box helicase n=1 Tax=Dyadobacter chenwenxiniae TaxID=2906456 RepID=UPI001F2E7A45|nr:DEAD/DEAH box helicase family protein [Dyadobacter chenwenxiniae]MCF0049272.1 DEAD/DEAH box helicase family protein [Dyadobacter chenwenxiniae]